MKKVFFAFTLLIALPAVLRAQNFTPCLTDELYQQAVIKHPELLKAEEQANELARTQVAAVVNNKKAGIKIIPVVFHVIHQNGPENISQAQIMDQIRILNEDYRKKTGTNGGASIDALATDMEIEFRLAQYDPEGKKHDGINRVFSALTNDAEDAVKKVSYWESSRYFNVWVVKSIKNTTGSTTGEVLGYAQFPTQMTTQPTTDGVVVRSDQIGVIGSGQVSQAGRTLTHEAGHWVGLYHPFQGGCVGGTTSNCSAQGDQVCDTPPVASASYGCTSKNSCSNDSPDLTDLIKDYMDYADGTCMNLFTPGQKTRVYGISFSGGSYRVNASSASNLNSVGLDANGSYLPVTAATKKAPYNYSFENVDPTADGWIINNFNTPTNGWQVKSGTSYDGNSSISMRNFTNTTVTINSRDGFQAPQIDLTSLSNPYVNFYYAYSQKSSANSDALNLTVSNNFGMNETTLFSKAGSDLSTTKDPLSTEFTPGSPGEWKVVSIALAPYKTFDNARFRFEFLNQRGNNIYIDQFSITNGPVAVPENDAKAFLKFSISPNPVQENTRLSFELPQSEQVKISLTDLVGREVSVLENTMLSSGTHSLNIGRNNLGPGVYFIRFQAGEKAFNHKLLIN